MKRNLIIVWCLFVSGTLSFLLMGCGAQDASVDLQATVDAAVELTIAAQPAATVEAPTPTRTTVDAQPTPLPFPTPAPTPTTPAIASIEWRQIVPSDVQPESYFWAVRDEFERSITYYPDGIQDLSSPYLGIGVIRNEDQSVILFWIAMYAGSDWIFLEDVKLRVGDNVVDFASRIRGTEATRNVDGGRVTEVLTFEFRQGDAALLQAILESDEFLVRLDGRDGYWNVTLTRDDAIAMVAGLGVFERLGGDFATIPP